MSETRVAGRYATTLLDLAQETKVLDKVLEDVNSFHKLTKESRDFYNFLKSPIIQEDKKTSILKDLFEGTYQDLTMKFLALLTKKNREALLPQIAEEFIKQYDELKQVTKVKVTSAIKLNKDLLKQIRKKLEQSGVAYENVEIVAEVDPSLIGGFILEFGNQVYDASIAHKLEDLRKEFKENTYTSLIRGR